MNLRITISVTALLALLAIAAAPASASRSENNGPEARPTGRLIATLDRQAAPRLDSIAARSGLRVADTVPAAGLLTVEPARGQSLDELRGELVADPRVERVSTEYLRELRYVPNDPAYGSGDPNAPGGDTFQWNLRMENFEQGWGMSTGSGASVAIIDTGVSANNPDLASRIVAGVDHDPSAPTGATSDENGHGTHVAGLACADSDNGYGIASSGFDCSIVAEKLDVVGDGFPNDTTIIAAIYDAANRGVDAINLSLGGGGANTALRDAIDYAFARGVVIVAAAENASTTNQGYPARYVQPTGTAPNLNAGEGLVVTMAQYNGANAGAGVGTGVTVAAYGDSIPAPPYPGIFSTWPANKSTREPLLCLTPPCAPRTSFGGDTRFAYLFGTSMAAPQVTGLAALIRSKHPGMSASDVGIAIRRSASGKGTWGDQLGWGIIDAGAALAAADEIAAGAGGDRTAPSSRTRSRRRSAKRRFKVRIEAGDPAPGQLGAVSVFVAKRGGRYRLLKETTAERLKFKGRRGVRYRFYSTATDAAGNSEAAPDSPDSVTRVTRKRKRGR